ncbi:unnamed protein product [Amoebophrya sp. A120]|nr:unnamed protein product [Amoebophrya sp. A120]|eukprot:GSA120T00020526001.1
MKMLMLLLQIGFFLVFTTFSFDRHCPLFATAVRLTFTSTVPLFRPAEINQHGSSITREFKDHEVEEITKRLKKLGLEDEKKIATTSRTPMTVTPHDSETMSPVTDMEVSTSPSSGSEEPLLPGFCSSEGQRNYQKVKPLQLRVDLVQPGLSQHAMLKQSCPGSAAGQGALQQGRCSGGSCVDDATMMNGGHVKVDRNVPIAGAGGQHGGFFGVAVTPSVVSAARLESTRRSANKNPKAAPPRRAYAGSGGTAPPTSSAGSKRRSTEDVDLVASSRARRGPPRLGADDDQVDDGQQVGSHSSLCGGSWQDYFASYGGDVAIPGSPANAVFAQNQKLAQVRKARFDFRGKRVSMINNALLGGTGSIGTNLHSGSSDNSASASRSTDNAPVSKQNGLARQSLVTNALVNFNRGGRGGGPGGHNSGYSEEDWTQAGSRTGASGQDQDLNSMLRLHNMLKKQEEEMEEERNYFLKQLKVETASLQDLKTLLKKYYTTTTRSTSSTTSTTAGSGSTSLGKNYGANHPGPGPQQFGASPNKANTGTAASFHPSGGSNGANSCTSSSAKTSGAGAGGGPASFGRRITLRTVAELLVMFGVLCNRKTTRRRPSCSRIVHRNNLILSREYIT